MGFTPIGMTMYVDRDLTRWEWVRVRVFRRRDPRSFGFHEFGPAVEGEPTMNVTFNSSGYFTFEAEQTNS